MHIKDYNDAMKFFRTSRQEESNGKWEEFVQRSEFEDAFPEPPAMAEGGLLVGTPTKEVTQFDKRIYETPEGERVSEKSKTFFFNGKWINVPSIHDGVQYDSEERLRNMLKQGKIQATSEHGSRIEAEEAAGLRSDMMKSHVKGFDDGGQVIGKPGGLVEPGVMYYGVTKRAAEQPKIYPHGPKSGIQVLKKPWRATLKTSEETIEELFPTKKEAKAFYDKKVAEAKKKGTFKTKGFPTSIYETTNKLKQDIDSWTKNWINKNMDKYEIREFDNFKNDLSEAWLKESKKKKYQIPGVGKIKARTLTHDNLPAISTKKAAVQPFKMLDFSLQRTGPEDLPDAYKNLFAKIFYKNHLNKNPELAKSFNSYLDYMVADKRLSKNVQSLIKQTGMTDLSKLIKEDVVYMLSSDSGLGGKARHELFTNTFGKKYNQYMRKINRSGYKWNRAVQTIKAQTGIDILKQLRAENEALKKLFKVKKLPQELMYAGDHIFGVSQAAKTGNKKFMQAAIDNLVGMTHVQNRVLGMHVFEKERGKLVNKINKATGPNKVKLVKELNTLMGNTYSSSFPKGTKFYTLDKGKLNINPNLKKLSQGERFMGWATEISKKPTKILKETFTDPGARKAILDFKKGNEKTLVKFFKDAGIDCIKGAGGQCNSIADFNKGYNKLVQEGAEGSAKAIQKLGKFTKLMRAGLGAAKWTGYGLLAEAGFMIPFAVGDYAAGESWKRILGNATDYGFGPILGQSEQEEFEAALPEGSFAVEGEKAIELGERLTGMEEQKVNPGYGRVGFEEKAPEQRQKVYTDILDEYEFNLQPFLSDTPFAKDQWHQGMWTQAHEEAAAARAQIEKEKLERLQKRRDEGTIAQEDWMVGGDTRGYASGGILSLKKKW